MQQKMIRKRILDKCLRNLHYYVVINIRSNINIIIKFNTKIFLATANNRDPKFLVQIFCIKHFIGILKQE